MNPISIHALRMERDTLINKRPENFNPRAPHGARLTSIRFPFAAILFQSTRSAWSATILASFIGFIAGFQSTRSAWSATPDHRIAFSVCVDFNPRAPHGARPFSSSICYLDRYFNPRAPHGARQKRRMAAMLEKLFQSTRSAWSATTVAYRVKAYDSISIHALRMERDPQLRRSDGRERDFNPRAPHGARQQRIPAGDFADRFQSTRSAWSATL